MSQSASVTEGCPPLAVSFQPPAGQATFYWEFQNGATSDQANPSTIFTQPNTYSVVLREMPGGPVVGTVDIVVYPVPELSIAADPRSGCRPLVVAFENGSAVDPGITVNSYSWTFGDGGSSGASNPTHIYTESGLFTVSLALNAEQQGCSLTETFDEFVTVGGIDDLNFLTFPNPPVTCMPPLEVTFFNTTATPGLSFSWDLGNGNTFDGFAPPSEVYTEPGEYPVILTATDSLGCTAQRTRTVRIEQPLLNANVPDTLCIRDTLLYTDWGIADSILWQFPSSADTGRTEDDELWIVFSEGGWQEVGYTAINYLPEACALDTVFSVFVDEVLVELEADPTFTCENDLDITFTANSSTAAEYFWLFQDGDEATGQTAQHTYTYIDTMNYSMNGLTPYNTTLLAINPSGCIDTFHRVDTIFVPNALFMVDQVDGCAPLTVTLADSSASFLPIVEWVYEYGDGTSATFTESVDHQHTFTEAGEYEMTVSILNEAGCRDTSYIRLIEVGDTLDYSFEVFPDKICPGEPIQLNIIDPPEVVDWWELESSPAFTLVAEYNGCFTENYMPFPLIVHGPGVSMSYELFCEDPNRVHFSADVYDITSIIWDFGDGNTSTELNPVHVYEETGDYQVVVTVFNDDNECPPVSDSRLVCIRNVEAAFSLPAAACQGEAVVLNADASVDVATEFCSGGYTWYFEQNGRPVQSNDSIYSHPFAQRGPDVVTLVVKDVNGCRDTVRHSIGIYGMDPLLTVSDDFICLPADVVFTDESNADTTITNWVWNFGDGMLSGSPNSAPYQYQEGFIAGDSIWASLQVTDAIGCSEIDSVLLQVYVPVSNVLSVPSPSNICVGDEISFTAAQFQDGGSFLNFSWDFDEMGQYSGQNVSLEFPAAGTVPYTLTFVEDASGCQSELAGVVNIQDFPMAAFVSDVDDEEVLCYPAQISFTNQSEADGSLSYMWDFGNGQFSSAPNPVGSFDKGTFTAQLISRTSFGCADTTSRSYTLVGPEGSFSFAPDTICQGESITFSLQDTSEVTGWSWDFGDGTVTDNLDPATHTYVNIQELGNRPVTLILRGLEEQCTFSITDSIFIHEVQANFALHPAGDTALCAGTYQFINQSTGADTYDWTLADGTMSSAFQPEISVTPGQYEVSLVVLNQSLGCIDTFAQIFSFLSIADLQLVGDTLCPGDTAQLRVLGAEPGYTYTWSPVDQIIGPADGPEVSALLDASTDFSVLVADGMGCLGEEMATAFVLEPFPWMDIDSVRCPGDALNVPLPEPGGLYEVVWDPGPPPDTIGEQSVDLLLTISDILGCFSDEYTFMVASLVDRIEVPNIFSPNGDGTNDVFRVFSAIDFAETDLIRIEAFRVYNRWGQKVYDRAGPDARWDGTVNGNEAPAEVYIYYIVVDIPKTGARYELTGEVTLIR